MACVPFNSRQDKTLNKSDIKLLEKKGEEKKYNNIQKETTDFSLLSNMAFNFFFKFILLLIFQAESSTKKTKWITDFVLMPQFTKFIISTG